MPVAAEASASVQRQGSTLVFAGELTRANIAALHRDVQGLSGLQVLDVQAVSALDSAGLSLLASLASDSTEVLGNPPGLAELRAAYRLTPNLGFGSA